MNPQVAQAPIVVVDDNETDVFFLEHRLHSAGVLHPLTHLEDGMDAIRHFEECSNAAGGPASQPWLIFVDLKMPRMDGFELLTWMRARGFGEHATLVVLSTSDEPCDIERATALGAHRYLVKYPQPAVLADIVAFASSRAAQRTWSSVGTDR